MGRPTEEEQRRVRRQRRYALCGRQRAGFRESHRRSQPDQNRRPLGPAHAHRLLADPHRSSRQCHTEAMPHALGDLSEWPIHGR